MKTAILKLGSIVLVILVTFILIVVFVFKKIDNPVFHKVQEDKNILIIGNSQSEFGIDDAIIPNSINLSQSGDCSFYNYFKGKKILEDNTQIRTVLFLYTNNMFLAGMDEWIYDEKHLGYKYPKYGHAIGLNGQFLLFRKNPGAYFIAVRDAVRTNLQLLIGSDKLLLYKRLDWGNHKTTDLIGDLKVKDADFEEFYADTTTSILDIQYIKKLYSYCKANDIKFILVRTPFHKSFAKVKEKELKDFHLESLDNIAFYDYIDSTFYDKEFKDIQHLNFDGATRFSNMLVKQLEKDEIIKTN